MNVPFKIQFTVANFHQADCHVIVAIVASDEIALIGRPRAVEVTRKLVQEFARVLEEFALQVLVARYLLQFGYFRKHARHHRQQDRDRDHELDE